MPWRGPQYPGEFPTLGYLVAEWIQDSCVIPDGEHAGEPFILPDWGLQFLLWMYRVHPDARSSPYPSRAFVFSRGGQLVEPQKKGKGPLSAAWICVEAQGPVIFDGWDAAGEPVGRPWPPASVWIQVTARSESQTDNIWRALVPMIELGHLQADIPDTGETRIRTPGGGLIEPTTSKAGSRLGQRITAAAQDEEHDWTEHNGGRRLADTQRRNLAGTGGRFLATGNAWDPVDESVAQQTFESPAPGVHKQMTSPGPGSIHNQRDRRRMLRKVYEGSWWVDLDRIEDEIVELLPRDPAQAERFLLNRIQPGAGAAYDAEHWATLADPKLEIPDGALVTVGVDGARFDDALALIATAVDQSHQWPLFVDERPRHAADDYEHDLETADAAMVEAFERFRVWRAYVDPQYIEDLLHLWQGRWGAKRIVPWWTNRMKPMAWAVRRHVTAVGRSDLSHDGDDDFARHIRQAVRRKVKVRDDKGRQMWVVAKDAPDSPRKIDCAPAAIISWEARGDAIAAGANRQRAGRPRIRARSIR